MILHLDKTTLGKRTFPPSVRESKQCGWEASRPDLKIELSVSNKNSILDQNKKKIKKKRITKEIKERKKEIKRKVLNAARISGSWKLKWNVRALFHPQQQVWNLLF